MGFPSPAQDYVEERISLDKCIITRPAATYFMRAGATHYREGIMAFLHIRLTRLKTINRL